MIFRSLRTVELVRMRRVSKMWLSSVDQYLNVSCGYVENIIYWSGIHKQPEMCLSIAAMNGDVQIIKDLCGKYPMQWSDAYLEAIEHGRINVIQFFRDRGFWTNDELEHAVKCGEINSVAFLLKERDSFTEIRQAIKFCAKYGRLKIFHYIWQTWDLSRYRFEDDIFMMAAAGKHIKFLKYSACCGVILIRNLFARAFEIGDLEFVEWCWDFYRKKCPTDTDFEWCIIYSIPSGNMKIIKWLLDKGIKITKATIRMAIGQKNLELLQYFVDNKMYRPFNIAIQARDLKDEFIMKMFEAQRPHPRAKRRKIE
jgi:hypothetical protein